MQPRQPPPIKDRFREAWSRAVCPRDDFLRGGLSAGASCEADESGACADRAGDLNGPGVRERGIGHGIRLGHRELGAVVREVSLVDVAAVNGYPAAYCNAWPDR